MASSTTLIIGMACEVQVTLSVLPLKQISVDQGSPPLHSDAALPRRRGVLSPTFTPLSFQTDRKARQVLGRGGRRSGSSAHLPPSLSFFCPSSSTSLFPPSIPPSIPSSLILCSLSSSGNSGLLTGCACLCGWWEEEVETAEIRKCRKQEIFLRPKHELTEEMPVAWGEGALRLNSK